MRIYVKDVDNPDEHLQVVNTSTSPDFFLPNRGDTFLLNYTVVNRSWISMEKGNDKIVINVKKSSKLEVLVEYVELKKNSIFSKVRQEVIKEKRINLVHLEQNPGTLPMIGESIQIREKIYKVKDIIKNGEGFNLSNIKIIIYEN